MRGGNADGHLRLPLPRFAIGASKLTHVALLVFSKDLGGFSLISSIAPAGQDVAVCQKSSARAPGLQRIGQWRLRGGARGISNCSG